MKLVWVKDRRGGVRATLPGESHLHVFPVSSGRFWKQRWVGLAGIIEFFGRYDTLNQAKQAGEDWAAEQFPLHAIAQATKEEK